MHMYIAYIAYYDITHIKYTTYTKCIHNVNLASFLSLLLGQGPAVDVPPGPTTTITAIPCFTTESLLISKGIERDQLTPKKSADR